jgi:peptidoglycan/xylan/chitin deacetylase (PgdA/CDA1 family)
MDLAGRAFWRFPGCFWVARMLGPSYSLRSVVFHHISPADSPFTTGINVRTTTKEFEAALQYLTRYYTPVTLQAILDDSNGRGLPDRAVLVTFDDAYASVAEVAAPLCRRYGVPAVFFVNAAFLNNQRLAPDNLVCYVANMYGIAMIRNAAQCLQRERNLHIRSLSDVFTRFFPSITLSERREFLLALRRLAGISERRLAEESALYLSTEQLRSLAAFDFEIGNHTYTHVHGRSLSSPEFGQEIDRNQAELEGLSGRKVRAFSQPYGSSRDLTPELAGHLERTGHRAVFLSESTANPRGTQHYLLDRVNPRTDRDDALFMDLEVLPRLRAVRNRLFSRAESMEAGQEFGVGVN